jgi:hypothetical protein
MPLRQPLIHRRRQKKSRIAVDHAEVGHQNGPAAEGITAPILNHSSRPR